MSRGVEVSDWEARLDSWMDKIWGGFLDKAQWHRAIMIENFDLESESGFEAAERELTQNMHAVREMSPPGKLLAATNHYLEAARWKYLIPDAAWDIQATFDRVFVYQVSQFNVRQARPGSAILTAEVTQDREEAANCEGILLSAGLKAMGQLRSNGIDLGHKVGFCQNYLWRKRVSWGAAGEEYIGLFLVGDITGSYDLASEIKSGEMRLAMTPPTKDSPVMHYYTDRNGDEWAPQDGDVYMGDQ